GWKTLFPYRSSARSPPPPPLPAQQPPQLTHGFGLVLVLGQARDHVELEIGQELASRHRHVLGSTQGQPLETPLPPLPQLADGEPGVEPPLVDAARRPDDFDYQVRVVSRA